VSYSKLSYINPGSSYSLPAHWAGGARARKIEIAAQNSVRTNECAAKKGGVWEIQPHLSEIKQRTILSSALLGEEASKKVFFSFQKKKWARAKSKKQRKLFIGVSKLSSDNFL